MTNVNLPVLLYMPTAMKPAILVDGFRRGRCVVSVPQHDDRSSDADFTAAVRFECRSEFQIDNLSKTKPSVDVDFLSDIVDSSTATFVYQRRHHHTETTYQYAFGCVLWVCCKINVINSLVILATFVSTLKNGTPTDPDLLRCGPPASPSSAGTHVDNAEPSVQPYDIIIEKETKRSSHTAMLFSRLSVR